MDDSTVSTLEWSRLQYDKNRCPGRRSNHSICSDVKNRNIYLFGGRSKGGCNNHLYVLSSNEINIGWKIINDATGNIPTPRRNAAIVCSQSYLYLFGGSRNDGGLHKLIVSGYIRQKIPKYIPTSLTELISMYCTDSFCLLNDLYSYNTVKKEWIDLTNTMKGSIPTKREKHTLTIHDNKIYIFGGHDGDELLNDLYVYDPNTSFWTQIFTKNAPEPRYDHSAVLMGNYLIISCGKSIDGPIYDYWFLDLESLNETKIKWQHIVPVCDPTIQPQPRWGQSAIRFHQIMIIFGGWNGTSCFNDVCVVNFGCNPFRVLQCKIKGVIPSIRAFHGCAVIGNNMIIFGGRNNKKRLNDTYCLDLSDIAPAGYTYKRPLRSYNDDTNDDINHYVAPQLFIDKNNGKNIGSTDFKLQETIGTGSFGRVRLVQYTSINGSVEHFAMKMMRKSRIVAMKQENHVKWEQKILHAIKHPFIANLMVSFQDKYFLYMVLEYVSGGEFFTLLKRAGKLELPHCAFYASQIVLVLQFLHSNLIIYRDLKPENILIDDAGYIKLTDFGFAKRLEKPYRTWTLCGTPEYIAPEILLNQGHSFSVDWWALGILLFEMFSGNPPFIDDNPMKIYQKILDGNIIWPLKENSNQHIIPQRGRELISQLLCKNISQRLNKATDVMKHYFFEGVNWKRVLDKRIKKVPWKPSLKAVQDTKHFDDYDENTDTENVELEDDPFVNDFDGELPDQSIEQIVEEEEGKIDHNLRDKEKEEPETIGLSIGGAKDINIFRQCIQENIMPKLDSITFSGLLYEYYFDTKTVSYLNKSYKGDNNNNNNNYNNDDNKAVEGQEDGSMLFYPTYCYAQIQRNNFVLKENDDDDKEEYYMTVGLNSNIRKNEFKRKHLNLVIVLDKSGSMSDTFKFADSVTKMMIANHSVVALFKHLTNKDRIGVITFDEYVQSIIAYNLVFLKDINLNQVKEKILRIHPGGGTNFEIGYNAALNMYKCIKYNKEYENRIIFATDAIPNIGKKDPKSLLNLISMNALNVNKRIYTTIIGVGLDFNSNLINKITKIRGCNYFTVKSNEEFMQRMDHEFEYMVTPLVFNVSLTIKCEGNACKIDKVYGSNNTNYSNQIVQNGEITKIDTLFPSKKSTKLKKTKIKGGILLIKLKKLNDSTKNMNVTVEVSFEDRNDKLFKTQKNVIFKHCHNNINYYDNLGIRKGILLCKYAQILMDWIKHQYQQKETTKLNKLRVSKEYTNIFINFLKHFENEKEICKDNTLQKEVDILKKLINLGTVNNIKQNPQNINQNNVNSDSYFSAMYGGITSFKKKFYG